MSENGTMYNKHRPKSLDQMVGQPAAVKTLQKFLDNDSLPHFLLFSGESGTGKTTAALILKTELDVGDLDYEFINCSDKNGVDDARDLIVRMRSLPMRRKGVRLYVLDEAQKLTNEAQNCLLNVLEFTPKHAHVIFTSTQPEKIIKAVQTRCTEVRFKPVADDDLRTLVAGVLEEEGRELDPSVFERVVEGAQGSPRKALVLLEQALQHKKTADQLAAIEQADVKKDAFAIAKALIWEPVSWPRMQKLLAECDVSDRDKLEQLRHAILTCAKKELIKPNGNAERAAAVIAEFMYPWYDCKESGLEYACYQVLKGKK